MTIDDIHDLNDDRWLRWGNLHGRKVVVTISDVAKEVVDGETWWILSFEGKRNQLTLNRTSEESLLAMFGRSPKRDWIGKRITLHATEITHKGSKRMAIRIYGSPDQTEPEITHTWEIYGPRGIRKESVVLRREVQNAAEKTL